MLEHEAVFRRVQGAIDTRARRGGSLSSIEEELIAPSGLPEAHKATLSLQASGHLEDGRRRYEQRQQDVRRQARGRRPAHGAD